jgi:hypothetical protein
MTVPDPVVESENPSPGSDAAIERGCCCPVIDNGHGNGYMGMEGVYVIAEGCPLHFVKPEPAA